MATERKTIPTAEALAQFAKLLRDRRFCLGLSRHELGELAKISEGTIKFIETLRTIPSRRTCLKLFGVAELKLGWDEFGGIVGDPPDYAALPAYAAERLRAKDAGDICSGLCPICLDEDSFCVSRTQHFFYCYACKCSGPLP